MSTALDLISDAMRRIGVLAENEDPTAAQSRDALADLNALIDQHAAERLTIFTTTRTEFSLVANQSTYLIGSEFDQATSDGFDAPWVGGPAGWTPYTTGDATINNDTTVFQAGGHSVRLSALTNGWARLTQDYVVQPADALTISVYLRAGFTSTGHVSVQNQETGNWLDSTGAWVGVESFVFTAPAGGSLVLSTKAFTVESAATIGAATTTLRIILQKEVASTFDAWFDTFSLTGRATVPIPRPVYLDHVSFIDSSVTPDQEMPLQSLTDDAWAILRMKDQTSPWPLYYYYNPTFPYGTLTIWPVPTSSSLQGVVYVPTQVPEFEAITDTFSMPPGYRRMLTTNLALELCPSYGVQPNPILVRQAQESMDVVKRGNVRMSDLSFDAAVLGGSRRGWYDIRNG